MNAAEDALSAPQQPGRPVLPAMALQMAPGGLACTISTQSGPKKTGEGATATRSRSSTQNGL